MNRVTRLLILGLGILLIFSGCASPFKRVQVGNPALPTSALSGGRWNDDGLAFLTRVLEIDGENVQPQSIWKDVDSKTEFVLPGGHHLVKFEVREHATFNEACRAYGTKVVEVDLAAGRRYFLRSTVSGNRATTELLDLSTFEAVATFADIPFKRGVLGLPAKL